ncbi:geranylgeranyltransferase beta subunit [Scheffersomyces amazonensis]|uniref:geranylgeranyltransferase beta subunit n=1 Tax=Scheffersomyces amazonensis TaxID=1078765 RepID=UPI00315D059B
MVSHSSQLYIEKHEKFFHRFLTVLPSKLQSEDANKLALIYFNLYGLSIIRKLNFSDVERKFFVDCIYKDYLLDTDKFTAFRSTANFKYGGEKYDLPNLSSTLFALQILLVLKNDYSAKLNNHKIMRFVKLSQFQSGTMEGSFAPTLINNKSIHEPFGESDIRLCYIAASIRKLVKYDQLSEEKRINDINVNSLIKYVKSRLNIDGGFSSQIKDESHLGYVYCALACLKLLDYDFTKDEEFESVLHWLLQRQVDYPQPLYEHIDYEYYRDEDVGGFNGRENKLGDTCYSWWCLGSLQILGSEYLNLTNLEKNYNYLLQRTQNGLLGGFSKDPHSNPDPYHSFLALASLSLTNEFPELEGVDESLVITSSSKEFWINHISFTD